MSRLVLLMIIIIWSVTGCNEVKKGNELPVLGRATIVEKVLNGKPVFDTIPHRIADFRFVDQDSAWITNKTFEGKVYVADFFFTSCPTICPVMKKEMLRVYDAFLEHPEVLILSHTIDPKHDTVAVLRDFAERLGVKSEKWHFVTGKMDVIYELAEKSYLVPANEDDEAPGGYIHSGAFILVDGQRRIRGVYDGTEPVQVDLLINDIKKLIKKNEATS